MDGSPLLPGFRFHNVTVSALNEVLIIFFYSILNHWLLYLIQKKDYNLSAQFQWKNGYAIPKEKSIGIGKDLLDTESMLYAKTLKDLKLVIKIFN